MNKVCFKPCKHRKTINAPVSIDFVLFFFIFNPKVLPIALALVSFQFSIILFTLLDSKALSKHSKTINAPVSIDFVLFFFIINSIVLPIALALVTNQFLLIF